MVIHSEMFVIFIIIHRLFRLDVNKVNKFMDFLCYFCKKLITMFSQSIPTACAEQKTEPLTIVPAGI